MKGSAQSLKSRESLSVYSETGAANDLTFRDLEEREQDQKRWQAVVDRLLQWMGEAQSSGNALPLATNIESAIDLVVDSRGAFPVPTSVGLTDDGSVGFEWNLGDELISIEVITSGRAELTRFRDGRVVEEGLLLRNPQTRRLELRGASDA